MSYPGPYSIRAILRMFNCVVLAALFTSVFPFIGRAQEISTSRNTGERDIRAIVADGVLRVAMTNFNVPPFHQRGSDGKLFGLDVDLARQIAGVLNVKMEIVDNIPSFDDAVLAVIGGRADIAITKLSQTYDRLIQVRFSDPYITWHHAMLYNRALVASESTGNSLPQEVLRTFRHRIGVIAESAYVDFARRNFPLAQIVALKSWEDVIAALREGRIEAIYRDEFEIRRILKFNPAFNVQFGAAILTDQLAFVSIAICDTCAKLQEFINYYLAQNRSSAYTLDGILSATIE